MKSKCLAAYTEENDWPAFINISENGHDVVILVRDRGDEKSGASNNFIKISIPRDDFFEFATGLHEALRELEPYIKKDENK